MEYVICANPFLHKVNKITGFSSTEQITRQRAYAADILLHKSLPTSRDIEETKEMLKDFKIKVDIPEFKNLSQLERWRKQIIKQSIIPKK